MSPVGAANATFCATLVDQWVASGVDTAFVAPGSRSTPLAVALIERSELRVEVLHDERSAGFAALGYGAATRRPAVVLCTSGTAATHFHGAVAEAGISCVPMIVCTANRPPELWGVGAPQTIDQERLYGSSVRSFLQPGAPDDTDPATWRQIADDAWLAAIGEARPGPVQLDLSFREPLVGIAGELPAPLARATPSIPATADRQQIADLADRLLTRDGRPRRGVIVAGRCEGDVDAIAEVADRLGWPIIADHRSALRDGRTLDHHDTLLRGAAGLKERTERMVRFGEPLSSKVLSQWIATMGAADRSAVNAVVPWSRVIDPERVAVCQIPERRAARYLLDELEDRRVVALSGWAKEWRSADDRLAGPIRAEIIDGGITEPGVAAASLRAVPAGGALVVSSSMPVRDVEWFGPPRSDVSVFSNRGANGIDGVVATAVGVAVTGVPTVCLIGDVALLHDASSLTGLRNRSIDLTIVVIDNDGGGIFSFLPQRDLLPLAIYERLFGTPHGTDFVALCAAHGLFATEFGPDVDLTPCGVHVVIARADRDESRALRNRIAELATD